MRSHNMSTLSSVPPVLSMTEENLTELKITFSDIMVLKPDLEEHIMATISLGQNELWSSANLYRQLHCLENLVPMVCNDLSTFTLLIPCQTEASSHTWIDAFFFRASAMLPPNQRMVLKTSGKITYL
jgi:hypothetical protein